LGRCKVNHLATLVHRSNCVPFLLLILLLI
jgi:hypothetical protein